MDADMGSSGSGQPSDAVDTIDMHLNDQIDFIYHQWRETHDTRYLDILLRTICMRSTGPVQPSETLGTFKPSSFGAQIQLLWNQFQETEDDRYLDVMCAIADEEGPFRKEATHQGILSLLNFDALISDEDCMKLINGFKALDSSMVPFNAETIKVVHGILRDPVDPQPVNLKRVLRLGDALQYNAVESFLEACHKTVKPGANRDAVKAQVEIILTCCESRLRRYM